MKKHILLSISICMFALLGFSQAQNIRLTFSSQLNCDWYALDSVAIINLSQSNYSTTLHYPDTILELSTNVGIQDVIPNKNMEILSYPNPFSNTTQINLHVPQAGNTTLILYDLLGRTITQHSSYLEAGQHDFSLESCPNGYYLLHINTPQGSVASKLLCYGYNTSSIPIIHYNGILQQNEKSLKLYDPSFPFHIGDNLFIQTYVSTQDSSFFFTFNYTVSAIKDTNFMADFYTEDAYDTIPIQIIDSIGRYDYDVRKAPCYYDSILWEKIILINTQEELDTLFSCTSTINPPNVDFLTQSVVIFKGTSNHSPAYPIVIMLTKKCNEQYGLKIDVWMGYSHAYDEYYRLIIIDYKLSNNEVIYLEKKIH